MFAARVGDVETARLLIAKGANVNEAGPNRMTPLVLASASGQETFAIALLDMGANPNAKDEFGATALHYALTKGITMLDQVRFANYVAYLFRPNERALVKALLAHKADPNARLEKIVARGGSGSRTDATIGATPFLLAAATPDPATMRILAAGGADPKIVTKNGLTAVMAAAGLGRGQDFTDEDKRLSLEAVRFAVELGGDVKSADKDGLTALHGAATNGADAVVEYLAQHGADLNARDKYQQTPLSAATGIRLPWIPYGEELGEIIQPAARDMLLKLGATPVDTKGYFKPPTEYSDVYRLNQSQRYDRTLVPVAK
jgi:ankyrin repeat protein